LLTDIENFNYYYAIALAATINVKIQDTTYNGQMSDISVLYFYNINIAI